MNSMRSQKSNLLMPEEMYSENTALKYLRRQTLVKHYSKASYPVPQHTLNLFK